MAYELTSILNRADHNDVKLMIDTISSYFNFTEDKKLREMFSEWEDGSIPIELNRQIEAEIRYLGSNDFAYAKRKLLGENPAGVPMDEILDDICKTLKIKTKRIGSLEKKLESLAKNITEQSFSRLSVEEQIDMLKKMNLKEEEFEALKNILQSGAKLTVAALAKILGPKVASTIIQGILINMMALFIGKEAAKDLLKIILVRFPWVAVWLGPFVTIAFTGWTIVDIAGPASRKIIPLCLHLACISLRDGFEEQ